MVVKLAAHLTNYLEKNKIIHKEKEIYTIGFSLMLNTALSYIVIILFSCKNNLLFESILFISSFGFLREYIGGYHANSYFQCFVQTILLYFLVIFALQIPTYFLIALTTISLLLLSKIAPIEHPNNPISPLKANHFKTMWKKRTLLCIIISFPLFYIKTSYGKIITINIILTTLLACIQYLSNKNKISNLISFSSLKLNMLKENKISKALNDFLTSFSSLIHLSLNEKTIHSKALLHIYSLVANIAFITAITTVNTVSRQTLYQPKLPKSKEY